MNKLIILLLVSCATSTSSMDQFFSGHEFVSNQCPPHATCTIDSWGDATVVNFKTGGNEGNLTFLKKRLKTITLLRPESVSSGVDWESKIRKRLKDPLVPKSEIVNGRDYTKAANTLVTKDGKITIDLNAKGEFQMVHIAR